MMRWLSAVALILYLGLLVSPQAVSTHALHLTPLADSQFQAISPLTGQASLTSEQDAGDDNDSSLPHAGDKTPLNLNLAASALPALVVLQPTYASHPVRAPPLYFFT